MKTIPQLDELVAERAWVARLAYRMVRDRDDAEDVAQETLLAALESPPGADRPARGWLGRVATNVVRLRYRGDTRRARREEWAPRPEPADDNVAALHKDQTSALLAAAVEALDEPYRSAVLLRFLGERSVAEVAAEQGVPVGTAGWRISEGLKRLRTKLDRDAGGDAKPWLLAVCPAAPLPQPPAASAALPQGGMTMSKIAALLLAVIGAATLVIYQSWSAADSSKAARPPEARDAWSEATPASEARVQPSSAAAPSRPQPATARSRGAQSAAAGLEGPIASPNDFEVTFAVVEGEKEVPNEMFSDLRESGSVLMECFEAYYQRSPKGPRGGMATLQVTLVQDEGLGPIITQSEYLTDRGSLNDEEFRTCVGEGGFALRVSRPIGAIGERMVLNVGVSHVPSRGANPARRSGIEACYADLRVRRPDLKREGHISDKAFGECMDRATGNDRQRTSALPPALQACLDTAQKLDPKASLTVVSKSQAFRECAARAGVGVVERDRGVTQK